MRQLTVVVSLALLIDDAVNALSVVLFLIGTTQDQRSLFEYLAQQLALRNHKVHTVKPILIPEEPRLVQQKLHLVHEITLKNLLPFQLYAPLQATGNNIPWMEKYDSEEHMIPYYRAHAHACKRMLNSDLVDKLKMEKLDLAIVYSGDACQLAIVHALQIPFIYFDTDGFTDETRIASGTPLNADIPSSKCSNDNQAIPALQRFLNGYCLLNEYFTQLHIPFLSSFLSKRHAIMDEPISRMFQRDYHIKKKFTYFPNVNEIKQQAELYFINTDPIIEFEHPLPPYVIPVGGFHIDEPRPLFYPWNMSTSDEVQAKSSSYKGVIIVSFGNQVNCSSMTQQQARSILNALSRFHSYRIYWRLGSTLSLPGISIHQIPHHINLTTFIPQNDLLADHRTKLLITNGGMQSIIEAFVYGVPVVGIPLYGTNRYNLMKVHNKGVGLILNKEQLSADNLYRTISEVLDNDKYKRAAKNMAREWRERPARAFDRVMYYIEDVGRNHGSMLNKNIVMRKRCVWGKTLNIDILMAFILLTYLNVISEQQNKIIDASSPDKDTSDAIL
ncbi:unnamed protein product [Anisakis simplex]|uniref:glucuronosyltransferase n=1 Tax=Anisakis simplex TaxID=6269 RepID=A0A158PN08_ANISI|nr:unnamed protein product [Anisakis simplex]